MRLRLTENWSPEHWLDATFGCVIAGHRTAEETADRGPCLGCIQELSDN